MYKTAVKNFKELTQRKSDSGNGYYLFEGLWGSCFIRRASNIEHIEIRANYDPKCGHTYTKIPSTIFDKCFLVVANFDVGWLLTLPVGGIIIGCDEAQTHMKAAEGVMLKTQTCIVYSPTGKPPTVDYFSSTDDCYVQYRSETSYVRLICPNMLVQSNVRYIRLNDDGYFYFGKKSDRQ
jgi:hypothetical protein